MYKKLFDGTISADTLLGRICAEERVGDSLSIDTINLYSRKIRQIARRRLKETHQQLTPEIVVRDLMERIASGEITQATARLEKAAALFWIAEQGQSMMDCGSSELWRYELAYCDIASMCTGGVPKKSNNTSSDKLKAFSDDAFELLMDASLIRPTYYLHGLLLFVRVNLLVGLRPVEWLDTRVICYQHTNGLGELIIQPDGSVKTSLALEVRNAKHSAIRGNGEKRIILLDGLSDVDINFIDQWLRWVSPMNSDKFVFLSEAEIYKKIFGSMQRVMRSIFIKNGWKGKIPTLYSTRHQAVANARADGLTKKEIAALFGHSSINTARRHYGKKTVGYSGRSLRPAPESLQAVRSTISVRPKVVVRKDLLPGLD